jgi:hypothetical protein
VSYDVEVCEDSRNVMLFVRLGIDDWEDIASYRNVSAVGQLLIYD